MGKIQLSIKGMHCRSCEILLEEKIKEVPNVSGVQVSYAQGLADVEYADTMPSHKNLESAIMDAGYELGVKEPSRWFSGKFSDYRELFIAAGFLALAYYAASVTGILDISLQTSNVTYGFSLLIGLVAGISTCMAIVGGLVLGISARHAEMHPEATSWQKFRPHLYFNLGRTAGYAIFGGVLGALGGVLKLSGSVQGLMTLAVGAFMVFLGIKLTGISPKIKDFSITLPSSVSRLLGLGRHQKKYSHTSSLISGALTFFLPCGFTQAMQLAAIGSGSWSSGALIMGLFAAGTAPALLSIGGLASVIKGRMAQRFYAIVGLAVFLFGLYNISNALALVGLTPKLSESALGNLAPVTDGYQVVRMTQKAGGYVPNSFTITKGVPVKWIINSETPYSCAASILMPSMGIQQALNAGENIITFTPTQVGNLSFSCSMGMYRGVFRVVETSGDQSNLEPTASATVQAPSSKGISCGASRGCGGCGGTSNITTNPQAATSESGAQKIKSNDNYGLTPNYFKVKAGVPVEWTWTITSANPPGGCMVSFNNYELGISTQENYPDPTVIKFTPQKTGDYDITCPMGMLRAKIKVE